MFDELREVRPHQFSEAAALKMFFVWINDVKWHLFYISLFGDSLGSFTKMELVLSN